MKNIANFLETHYYIQFNIFWVLQDH